MNPLLNKILSKQRRKLTRLKAKGNIEDIYEGGNASKRTPLLKSKARQTDHKQSKRVMFELYNKERISCRYSYI